MPKFNFKIPKATEIINKLPNSSKIKSLAQASTAGFLAGALGPIVPTAATYPTDTQNIRQQSGQPPARTLKEKYKGFDTKMYKTIASIGLTFAFAKPLEEMIKTVAEKRPKATAIAAASSLGALALLGAHVHKNLNKQDK